MGKEYLPKVNNINHQTKQFTVCYITFMVSSRDSFRPLEVVERRQDNSNTNIILQNILWHKEEIQTN